MKKIVLLALLAILLAGCEHDNPADSSKEPKESVAKDATWDFCLIGSWRYTEEGSDVKSDYPTGIETFYANGDYVCFAEDTKGQKVVVNGTWRLDDKEEFVVWVAQDQVMTANQRGNIEKKNCKYVINCLKPQSAMVYQVGDVYRLAEWVE